MSRQLLWLILLVCVMTAFLVVAYPLYVIQPFKAQAPNQLALALRVREWAPWLGVAAMIGSFVAMVKLWRGKPGMISMSVSGLLAGLAVAFALLGQVNIFEKMFHRVDHPEFVSASAAKLDADDMVLAVKLNGSARAYPIRNMGYHHVVNDAIGGQPIVSTY